MAKKHKGTPRFDLGEVLQLDALELLRAKRRGKVFHEAMDIHAGGSAVEGTVREILRRRLPTAYHTGEGHIVDRDWNASPQYDVIIADNAMSPVLVRELDGSEWFTYEAVYAIGEVRTSYYKVKSPVSGKRVSPIQAFVENLSEMRSRLKRERNVRPELAALDNHPEETHRQLAARLVPLNPLFTFMLFVESGRASNLADVAEMYRRVEDKTTLPSLICFLDRGLIGHIARCEEHNSLDLYPGWVPILGPAGPTHTWQLFSLGSNDKVSASHLALLYAAILSHIQRSTLKVPRMEEYFQVMLQNGQFTDLASIQPKPTRHRK